MPVQNWSDVSVALPSSTSSPGYCGAPATSPVIYPSPVPHGSDTVHVPYSAPKGENFQPAGGPEAWLKVPMELSNERNNLSADPFIWYSSAYVIFMP
jgi:hypothetical protein